LAANVSQSRLLAVLAALEAQAAVAALVARATAMEGLTDKMAELLALVAVDAHPLLPSEEVGLLGALRPPVDRAQMPMARIAIAAASAAVDILRLASPAIPLTSIASAGPALEPK